MRTSSASVVAVLVLVTTVGGSQAAADTEPAVGLASAPEQCADFTANLRTLNMTEVQYDAFTVCDSLALGNSARPLRTPSMVWDAACVSAQGWELEQESSNPVPPALPYRALSAEDLAPCGTVTLGPADCAALAGDLMPAGQLSAATAALLYTLGCDPSAVSVSNA